MARKIKHPKTIWRKLGRENTDGQAHDYGIYGKEIEIDSRLKGKAELETMIHERLHFIFPEMDEEKILTTGEILSDYLWIHGFRRIKD